MQRLIAFLILATSFAMPGLAQDEHSRPTLTASGFGESHVKPDIAIVNLGVVTRSETPTQALATNGTSMKDVIAAITGAGVAEADIATSGFSINPVFAQPEPGQESMPPKVLGYEVSNQVTVRIRNFDQSGDILDKVVAAGANSINGISFDIANPQVAKDQATTAAIGDARRKAELMAEAAGVRLGALVEVNASEDTAPSFAARSFAATPIMGGDKAISVTAILVWEIHPK